MTDSTYKSTPKEETNIDAEMLNGIQEMAEKLLKDIHKLSSIPYSNLCFTRAILYLLLTGCSFIPLRLDDEVSSIVFAISSVVITIISYFILKEKKEEPKISKVAEWAFIIVFFLCLFGFTHYSVFRDFEERHYIFLFPCGVDLLCGILYKCCYITKHYKVYLPIFVVTWLTYVGLNLGLEEWEYFAFVFGFFSITLGTRLITVYQVFAAKDDRLCYPVFGTCLVLTFHFIPISAIIAGSAFVSFYILKCLCLTLEACLTSSSSEPSYTVKREKYILLRVE